MLLENMWFSSLAILIGFTLLVWGADKFVYGASATASNLGVSPLIIGLTIVGFGTSAPEILVSVMAAIDGNPGLAVGNALGSNITNIGLVLGITAIITPLAVKSNILRREYPLMFIVMLVALALITDNHLSRLDGIILLVGLVLVMLWMVILGMKKNRVDPLEKEFAQEIPHISMGKALFWVLVGLAILLLSSRLLVWGAVNVARALEISDLVIGLTVVAIGTSLPELAASVMSAIKKEPDIAIGNVIGSNIFNLLAVLGVPAIIHPMALDPAVLSRDFVFMIAISIVFFVMAYGIQREGRINRIEGGLLVCAYGTYMVILYYSVN